MSSSPRDITVRQTQVRVGNASLHVLESGAPDAPAIVFLHGWPQSARAWSSVMSLAAADFHAVAPDLPGVGGSTGEVTDGSKAALARVVHGLIKKMGLRDVVLVGHDVGGMITYSYLRQYADINKAVILDVVIPGLKPWEKVLRNPYLWHFALHSVPELPERLVQGNQATYFDYFHDTLSADKSKITAEARAAYAAAYASDQALTAGFNWYRTFPVDAQRNATDTTPIITPLLYLRGEATMRMAATNLEDYVDGFRHAGLRHVSSSLVPNAGHTLAEDAPEATWELIADFTRS